MKDGYLDMTSLPTFGGEEPAESYIRAALHARKHVVTANKELMAKSGPELLAEAHVRGLALSREHHLETELCAIALKERKGDPVLDLLFEAISSIGC